MYSLVQADTLTLLQATYTAASYLQLAIGAMDSESLWKQHFCYKLGMTDLSGLCGCVPASLEPDCDKAYLQAQELITALHNACQQLASTATGKAAEARLQKALDKLQKLQQKPVETTAASAAVSQLTTRHAQHVEAPTGTGQQAAGAEQKAASMDQNSAGPLQKEDIALVPGGEVMAEGASGQGLSAAALAEPSQANGEPPSTVADVEMTPVEDQDAGSAKENTAPLQGQGGEGQQPSGDEQPDKGMLLAEKKAQKEEAKVRGHKSLRECILLS